MSASGCAVLPCAAGTVERVGVKRDDRPSRASSIVLDARRPACAAISAAVGAEPVDGGELVVGVRATLEGELLERLAEGARPSTLSR